MEDERKHGGSGDEILNSERVVNLIVSVFVALLHEINCVCRRGEKEDLHDGVVESQSGMPGFCEEEIEIAGAEDDHVENLGLERETCTGMRGLDLEKKQEDGDNMQHVAAESEYVHDDGFKMRGLPQRAVEAK